MRVSHMGLLRLIEKPISYFLSNERVITLYTTRYISEGFKKYLPILFFSQSSADFQNQ